MVQEEKIEIFGVVIPDKKYLKIGETSSLLGVKPHVLRYWETEFSQIRPYKSRTGQRLYRRQDVETLAKIQRLLYNEKFTIAGAKQALKEGIDPEELIAAQKMQSADTETTLASVHQTLIQARHMLVELKQIIDAQTTEISASVMDSED